MRLHGAPGALQASHQPRCMQLAYCCKFDCSWKRSVAVRAASTGDSGTQERAPAGPKTGPILFTLDRWKQHKMTSRYWRHLSGIFSSETFQHLLQPLTTLAASSALLCLYQQLVQMKVTPEWMPLLNVSNVPFEQTSFALSLLLVFRTDASYSRWTEAINVWSDVHSGVRGFVIDASSLFVDVNMKQMAVRWTDAYCKTLDLYVRPGQDPRQVLAGGLLPHELDSLAAAGFSPHHCLHVLTELVHRARPVLGEVREDRMVQAIMGLTKLVATSEKLINHPIPLAYTRHTSRFMLLWLALLPLALWDDLGWLSIAVMVMIAYLLLGIEEIGVQIEQPFASLPLPEITCNLSRDIAQIAASQDGVDGLVTSVLGPGSRFDRHLEAGEGFRRLRAEVVGHHPASNGRPAVFQEPEAADGAAI